MKTRMIRLAAASVTALVLVACSGSSADEPETVETPEVPPTEQVIDDGYDREESRARATALIGVHEDDVEESMSQRIVRRGDEHFAVTMDLRPGRLNIELDEVDGAYVVTRVVVEVADGEDPLVVE